MALNNRRELENEILELELRLKNARSRLREAHEASTYEDSTALEFTDIKYQLSPYVHSLLLIADSALPLGSFAYSSGLESFIAHQKAQPGSVPHTISFKRFLKLSISSVSRTSLPYLLAAYRSPSELQTLDNDLDASTPCTVARRASVAQGRALIGVWEKSFGISYLRSNNQSIAHSPDPGPESAMTAIKEFSEVLKTGGYDDEALGPNGHFAPLWGVVCAAMGIEIGLTAYTFMLNHTKAVLSAAVRASVMGPYQAQSILAGDEIRSLINERIKHDFYVRPEDAGQVTPVLDLWLGRHELLYSRIFNS